MTIHPASQIITWCILVATMQAVALDAMLIIAGLVLLIVFVRSGHRFIKILRRTRWIMLSLLLVYAYGTPGQLLLDSLGMFSPTREGLTDGALQLTRLITALGGLAILLERLDRQQLISGLYTLFAPLQWMGISRERLAVRLALTLHYAEVAMLREPLMFRKKHTWQGALNSLIEPHGLAEDRKMELPLSRFTVADALLLSGALLMFWASMR